MKKAFLVAAAALFLVGAGCSQTTAQQSSTSTPAPTTYAKKTITIGGIITVEIPASCNTEGAAGSTYITCPTVENPTPIPEFTLSSDGSQVNIRRWEDLESPYWDPMLASLKIITPLDRAVQINIDR